MREACLLDQNLPPDIMPLRDDMAVRRRVAGQAVRFLRERGGGHAVPVVNHELQRKAQQDSIRRGVASQVCQNPGRHEIPGRCRRRPARVHGSQCRDLHEVIIHPKRIKSSSRCRIHAAEILDMV